MFCRVFKAYEGQLKFDRNAFINDALTPRFNTLQSDLYDQSMAEVLGRVQTTEIGTFPAVASNVCTERFDTQASNPATSE